MKEEDIMEMVEMRRKELDEEELAKTNNLKVVTIIMSYALREYKKIKNENKA